MCARRCSGPGSARRGSPPRWPGGDAERLVPVIREVLTEAIAAGGSTLRDYVQASGELGYFQHSFAVYDRAGQACPGCTCDISRTGGVAADRSGQPLDFLLSTTPALMYQFSMPHHPVLTSAVLAALLLAAAPFGAARSRHSSGPGGRGRRLRRRHRRSAADAGPCRRRPIRASSSTSRTAGSSRRWRPAGCGPPPCRSFYADTAPQLGWKPAGRGTLHARRRVAADRADRRRTRRAAP